MCLGSVLQFGKVFDEFSQCLCGVCGGGGGVGVVVWVCVELVFQLFDGFGQVFGLYGFEYVVDCGLFKGVECELVICGYECYQWMYFLL